MKQADGNQPVENETHTQLLANLGVADFQSAMLVGQYPAKLPAVPDKQFYRMALHAADLIVDADKPVLIGDMPEKTSWQSELGLLVSRLCPVIVWLAPCNHRVATTDLLALAFTRSGQLGERSLYRYELDSYNPRREWNNPEHWAHPGNYR